MNALARFVQTKYFMPFPLRGQEAEKFLNGKPWAKFDLQPRAHSCLEMLICGLRLKAPATKE